MQWQNTTLHGIHCVWPHLMTLRLCVCSLLSSAGLLADDHVIWQCCTTTITPCTVNCLCIKSSTSTFALLLLLHVFWGFQVTSFSLLYFPHDSLQFGYLFTWQTFTFIDTQCMKWWVLRWYSQAWYHKGVPCNQWISPCSVNHWCFSHAC